MWTVNGQLCLEVIKRLRQAERRMRPEGWIDKPWMLHHNAPAHTSLLVREFLTNHETTVVPQPPCPPDLTPAGFSFLVVPEVDIHCERSPTSDNRRNRKKNRYGTYALSHKTRSRTVKKRWKRCSDSGEVYFEGDKQKTKQTLWSLVRERTIPTERPPLVNEI
jgi:hypothetical protein